MKRIAIRSVFLILLILCLFTCASAEKRKEGDWEYEIVSLDETKTTAITRYNPAENSPETLTVPEKLGGYPVTRISSFCFRDYREDENRKSYSITGPKTLVLPACILHVEPDAIQFSDLEEIRIENGTNYDTADGVLFERATDTLVTYPRGRRGETYAIPEGTRIVGGKAFKYVQNLREIRVPETVRVFREDAFCTGYLSLNIPESMEKIEEHAFSYSARITSASPRFPVTDDCLIDAETNTLLTISDRYGRYNMRTYIIPEGVERIGEGALDNITCNRFVFPSTLKEIGKNNSLVEVKSGTLIFPEGLVTIGESFSVRSVKKLVFPSSLRTIGRNCFNRIDKLETVEFREGVEFIDTHCFTGNDKMKSVRLPMSLKMQSNDASGTYSPFSKCPNLTASVMPDSPAENYCRRKGIPFRYPVLGLWQADSQEAEGILSIRGAENIRIRLGEDALELTYSLAGREETKEIYGIEWQGKRLEMSEGYLEYTLAETYNDDNELTGEQLILTAGDAQMHLTRIEEEQ